MKTIESTSNLNRLKQISKKWGFYKALLTRRYCIQQRNITKAFSENV